MPTVVVILKVALLVFIVGGVVAIVTRGIRRSHANRGDPKWRPSRNQPGFEASAHGAMPSTPLPEWVDWEDGESDNNPRRKSEGR
ncbi:hypothetical protein H7J91_28505 [Mycolicibacterium rhodesiae]|nr:hypothetical protein [Mycolicibacterium rhodesiae]